MALRMPLWMDLWMALWTTSELCYLGTQRGATAERSSVRKPSPSPSEAEAEAGVAGSGRRRKSAKPAMRTVFTSQDTQVIFDGGDGGWRLQLHVAEG